MASIQLGGLATGIDTTSIISQLMAVERQPVAALATQKVKLQAISASFLDLNSKLLTAKTAADSLKSPDTFFPRSITSSDETVATAATTAVGSARGSFQLTVSGLARASIATAANTKTALSDTVASVAGTFEFKLGATGTTVSVAVDTSTTLQQLVTAINEKNAGVKATAINAGTSAAPAYKLALTGTASGEANDIVIAVGGDGTTLGVTNTLAAKDAEFNIAGLGDFKRSTNTFSDVLDGVSITLKASIGTTDLSVAPDAGALQNKVLSLLTAYNTVVTTITGQSKITKDASGATQSGAFTGDSAVQSIQRGLASGIATNLGGTFSTLSRIGITTDSDGTLILDATKFQAAVTSDPQAVSDLIAGTSTKDGIADVLSARIDTFTKAVTGSIAARRDGLASRVLSLGKQIDQAQARLDATEVVMRNKFNNLEQLVSKLQSTGSSLMSSLDAATTSLKTATSK